MRNREFEKLLKDAILLAAEEQGTQLDSESTAPVPSYARARLDAAMDKKERKSPIKSKPASFASQKETQKARKPARRWLGYAMTAAALTAVVFTVALMIRANGTERPTPGVSALPDITATPTAEPTPTDTPEPMPEPTPAPKPYITQFVNPGPDAVFGSDAVVSAAEMQERAKAFLEHEDPKRLEDAADQGIDTLKKIVQNSDEPGIFVFTAGAESYFTADAEPFIVLQFPQAVDTTRKTAGELYDVRLIYTTNTPEQIQELYRDALIPLAEHWYMLTVYYERSTVPGVFTMPNGNGIGESYLELDLNGTARFLQTHYADGGFADEQFRFDADPDEPNGILFSKGTLLKSAIFDPETGTLLVRFSDGSERTAMRADDIVLPRSDPFDRSSKTVLRLPVSCPVSALNPALGEHAEKGQLFLCDVDGEGGLETISFDTDADGYLVIRMGEEEYRCFNAGKGAVLREAILLNPHETTGELTLALETKDAHIDNTTVDVLWLQKGKVHAHVYYPNTSMYLSDGDVYFRERCFTLGSITGTSLRQGNSLRNASDGWVETGVPDRVKDMTREEQIEYHDLIKVVRDLPCTIEGTPAVIEAGTWLYVLRWQEKGTPMIEVQTEDGRIATLTFTREYDQSRDLEFYTIDDVDAETYFDNLDMAG